jgi:hypothetical protein
MPEPPRKDDVYFPWKLWNSFWIVFVLPFFFLLNIEFKFAAPKVDEWDRIKEVELTTQRKTEEKQRNNKDDKERTT